VNGAALFPAVAVDQPTTALMKLTFTQFLTPWLGLFIGKIDGLEADNNAFAHDWRTQFLNLGLTLNMTAAVAPVSAWGGGVAVLPWKGARWA
jgi:hypothetical protein